MAVAAPGKITFAWVDTKPAAEMEGLADTAAAAAVPPRMLAMEDSAVAAAVLAASMDMAAPAASAAAVGPGSPRAMAVGSAATETIETAAGGRSRRRDL